MRHPVEAAIARARGKHPDVSIRVRRDSSMTLHKKDGREIPVDTICVFAEGSDDGWIMILSEVTSQ